jgi:hypothetical protein
MMKKVNEYLLKFLLFAMPLNVILLVWAIVSNYRHIVDQGKAVLVIWEILAWIFIIWFTVFVFVLIELLLYPDFRSQFFASAARLAGINERDERESQSIDKAARYAYISTLSFMVFILLFYTINVTVGKVPPDKAVNGKTKTLSIGVGFVLTDEKHENKPEDAYKIFSNWDLPVSKWSLVALIIAWHLVSFLFYLRRTNRFS